MTEGGGYSFGKSTFFFLVVERRRINSACSSRHGVPLLDEQRQIRFSHVFCNCRLGDSGEGYALSRLQGPRDGAHGPQLEKELIRVTVAVLSEKEEKRK